MQTRERTKRFRRWVGASTGVAVVAAFCTAGAAQAGGRLYFADAFRTSFRGEVRAVFSDGFGLTDLAEVDGGLCGLALDSQHRWLFWSEIADRRIVRANLNGTQMRVIISEGLEGPVALAVAPEADLLFWGDAQAGVIGRAHLDGSGAAPLITTPFGSGLAIDRQAGMIYWSTVDAAPSGRILRARYDGTGIETVITGQSQPGTLAVDGFGRKVYWTDNTLGAVRRASFDGMNVETLYTAEAGWNMGAITLDLSHYNVGRVFWGQFETPIPPYAAKIMVMGLDGADPHELVTDVGAVLGMDFSPIMLGDINCDGLFNFADIDPFVLALMGGYAGYHSKYPGCDFLSADINGDGRVDFLDIDAFVRLIPG